MAAVVHDGLQSASDDSQQRLAVRLCLTTVDPRQAWQNLVKIALIYDAVYPWVKGGGETALYELAINLRNRGHEPHLFAMQYWDGPADMVRDGLHYHGLCSSRPLYNDRGRRTIRQALRFGWGILTRLPRHRLRDFDVVDVTAFPFFSVLAFWLVRLLFARRTPWVLTWLEVWGPDYWTRYLGRSGQIGAFIEWLCARIASAHLCISPTTARRLRTILGVSEERIRIIPRGFHVPSELRRSAHKVPNRIVVVGRLVDYKRVDLVVRAMPVVLRHLPDAELHVIGDGPERPALTEVVRDTGMASAVRFHGQLPERDAVLRLIATADVLALPSIREGQSMVALEAMALGTVVLVAGGEETAVADLLDTAAETSWSILPCTASPDEWGRRLAHLLTDPALLDRLARHERGRAAMLNWQEHIAPQVEVFYNQVIQGWPTKTTDL